MMRYKKLVLNVEHDPQLLQMFESLVKLIPDIPLLDSLIENATLYGKIFVDFVSQNECQTNGSMELRNNKKYSKIVKSADFLPMFSTLLTVLYNAKCCHTIANNPLNILAKHFDDADNFALAKELAAYKGVYQPTSVLLNDIANHHKEVFTANGLAIFNDEFDRLINECSSFEVFWKAKNSPLEGQLFSHADIYRQQYQQTTYVPLSQLKKHHQKDSQTFSYNHFSINTDNDPEMNHIAKALMILLAQIPLLDDLIQQATQQGTRRITVDFVQANQCEANAIWIDNGLSGNIQIVKEDKRFSDMFAALIFELCNAKNTHFTSLQVDDFEDADAFAKEKESLEYHHTYLPTQTILETILKEHKSDFEKVALHISDDGLQRVKDKFQSFEDWWNTVNTISEGKSYSHADVYRNQYDTQASLRLLS
ncbi:hypothetical protein [Candidatus Berkiella aquae]|uniref:Uncharacterized protein n=1 Tax=Candidatus Berkiella aquae TaxID=295108 RepID=A0A0Q9YX89_9GAMM|nr:hypothetical protein [Candidatus Berkiella aquae]MCS5711068.1 hypothetical protein [Candidatus Berkiella aquae]